MHSYLDSGGKKWKSGSICGKEVRRSGRSVEEREGQEILLCMQRDTSAYANTSLDNFLHHHEDFSRWRTNADWMVLEIQAGVLCGQGLASGREKKVHLSSDDNALEF